MGSYFQLYLLPALVCILVCVEGQMSYVLDHRVARGENQTCNGPLLFLVDCANSWWSETFLFWKVEPGGDLLV